MKKKVFIQNLQQMSFILISISNWYENTNLHQSRMSLNNPCFHFVICFCAYFKGLFDYYVFCSKKFSICFSKEIVFSNFLYQCKNHHIGTELSIFLKHFLHLSTLSKLFRILYFISVRTSCSELKFPQDYHLKLSSFLVIVWVKIQNNSFTCFSGSFYCPFLLCLLSLLVYFMFYVSPAWNDHSCDRLM